MAETAELSKTARIQLLCLEKYVERMENATDNKELCEACRDAVLTICSLSEHYREKLSKGE